MSSPTLISPKKEMHGALHPGQHTTALVAVSYNYIYSKQVSKATIEKGGLPSKTTKHRKHQQCKRGMQTP